MSATLWIGARLLCASPTILTIARTKYRVPTRSARITSVPRPFTVPPMIGEPAVFSNGSGSPVTIDSSTELSPSITLPSTGIFSPGRIRSRSPT